MKNNPESSKVILNSMENYLLPRNKWVEISHERETNESKGDHETSVLPSQMSNSSSAFKMEQLKEVLNQVIDDKGLAIKEDIWLKAIATVFLLYFFCSQKTTVQNKTFFVQNTQFKINKIKKKLLMYEEVSISWGTVNIYLRINRTAVWDAANSHGGTGRLSRDRRAEEKK